MKSKQIKKENIILYVSEGKMSLDNKNVEYTNLTFRQNLPDNLLSEIISDKKMNCSK
ncbi:hypothetical protein [Columbia Basin potato purple top phytoplasma]|uniref:Uncharacterized protein n=1 Tax=Columbia Basin potato purple top phytoplasma TaxID=307134 RepID=A0ABT5LBW1_9MOLU|nr:hypothetical protein [Columbia Basin potato purple top phytoplasma]MDC9032088.1 hypothetical protein [Columbia Basin potato purple top phytoplasma]